VVIRRDAFPLPPSSNAVEAGKVTREGDDWTSLTNSHQQPVPRASIRKHFIDQTMERATVTQMKIG